MKRRVKHPQTPRTTKGKYKRLEQQAARFFASSGGREEIKAFEKASLRTLGRD